MKIFSFTVGDEKLFADPFAVERTLALYLGGDPKAAGEAIESPIPEIACQAMQRLKAASCAAFDLKPFDKSTGEGTDEGTVLRVFNEFIEWREKKNQTTENSSTLPPSLAFEMPAPPGGWNSVLKSLMESGCCEGEQSTNVPTPTESAWTPM